MAVPTKAAAFVASSPSFAAFRSVAVASSLHEGDTKKYIGTHNGTFHCDEALAVSMLKLLPKFATHDILRTRDESKLAQCEIIVDVGGIYNPETLRFDHHQRSFTGTFDQRNIKLSSAGLVYKHFGREIIQHLAAPSNLDEATLDMLHRKAYKNFIEHIDGIDNGVEVATAAGDAKLTYNYQVSTNLSSRVSYLNPRWNEDQSELRVNEQFLQAMYMTITEFTDAIHDLLHSWLPAREIVEKAITERFQTHKSGEIVYLPDYCPWKSHLVDIEEKLLISGQIKFVLYNDATGNMVRVQAINAESGSFALRRALALSAAIAHFKVLWKWLPSRSKHQISHNISQQSFFLW
ncbi:Predicted metal-binding protein [Plasmopara halstedii]|uniref:Predicted metal-binding protein n=1 Tax=Plasmopara halstedii TaxID=4781 RepID=A0A0P1AXQ8_PLAHL|nr:Predicted metal-binding protein [Plasmopara halstedii]CEG46615.1 Predicted metal-binding protein [Plasmopara halstedii]|eukprot:XP_024582984.1 Predicted metal-binding protein [Plasmopara halstedii]